MTGSPLVTIGIPTYNRLESLVQAVESARTQDWVNLEIVISDNASTDGTLEYCEELVRRDERVRYIRQPDNVGAAANFSEVLSQATGELFMWLADDDAVDDTYVSACARLLLERADHVLVCGRARYLRGGQLAFSERPVNLSSRFRGARLLGYYRAVTLNGTFYGLMRREQVAALPFPRIDWLLVASLAYQGKVRTLSTVTVWRSIEGASQDSAALGASLGLTSRQARSWPFVVARAAFDDIRTAPVYDRASAPTRLALATAAWLLVTLRFAPKAWLAPVLVRLGVFERARGVLERRRRRKG